MSEKKPKEKILKEIRFYLICFAVFIVAVVIGYLAYVVFSYYRIEDNLVLDVDHSDTVLSDSISTDTEYTVITYNIGFGAYIPEYSFFMDGGSSSWASSGESVREVTDSVGKLLGQTNSDFILLQEVDIDSTRSFHVNQQEKLTSALSDYDSCIAINYDSPFLFYPVTEPHGKSKSGILTMSRYTITGALRRSFPVSESLSKLIDLDRCLSVSRVKVDDGHELVIINLHMSAYSDSEEVRLGQTGLIAEVMSAERAKGNYVICGGDFNHNLKALEDEEGAASWAHAYDRSLIPEGFSFVLDSLTEEEKDNLPNTNRDAGEPYDPETTFTITLDGFIISDNIEVVSYEHIVTGFAYSDHEPVKMAFKLKAQ